ncbi:signal peptidase I [Porphyromonas sp. COT-290 OH860]|uniref:signal peptidase I n=1 Tax=Porphyromonas sp. COT-290 OH860 TaxID=1515615 RepID=UPI0009DD5F7A|nr:signal peptidase I [Porphyromonas sp. COT-290 OH860]
MNQIAKRSWLRYGAWPLLTLVVVLILRFVILSIIRINGETMAPTITSGSYAFGIKFLSPRRGDIVLFRLPKSHGGGKLSVARIVALPGDSITYRSGKLFRSGEVIHSYPNASDTTTYSLRLPRAGERTALDPLQSVAFRQAIEQEMKRDNVKTELTWRQGRLYIQGAELKSFGFAHDYYWLLLDNLNQTPDSRHIGIISAEQIEAVVLFHL